MRLCRQCGANRTEFWKVLCETCTSALDAERFIIGVGPPSLRYRLLMCCAFVAAVLVGGLLIRYLVAPVLGFGLSLIGGDLANALALTLTFLIVIGFALLVVTGAYLMMVYLKGDDQVQLSVSNAKIATTLIYSTQKSGPTISTTQLGLHEITSIAASQNALGKALNYGTVTLYRGPDNARRIAFHVVISPDRLAERLRQLVTDVLSKPALLSLSQAATSAPPRTTPAADAPRRPLIIRLARYALSVAAVVGLPTYCNLKTL